MQFDMKFSYKIIKVHLCAIATHAIKMSGKHCPSLRSGSRPALTRPSQGLQINLTDPRGFIMSKGYWVQNVLAQEEKLTIS